MALRAWGRPATALLATLLLTVGLSACDSAGSSAPEDPAVDINSLDVGGYSTGVRDIGVVKNEDQARFIEAERLGDHIPLPTEIDPTYSWGSPGIATVFIDPEASLGKIMAVEEFRAVVPDFIGGFVSSGSTQQKNEGIDLINAVMIFPSEQRAAEAAVALERSDFEHNNRNQPIGIPGYPTAKAHWQPQEQSIGSWFATGNLVIYTWVYDYVKIWLEKVDRQALLDLATKSLDTIVPAVRAFRPTPTDQLMSLPRDREGMLGRTLQRPAEDSSWINPPGVYTGAAAPHFSSNIAESSKLLTDNGVDLYATDANDVYRARDPKAARAVSDELGSVSRRFTRSAAPKNLPFAHCKEYIGRERLAIRFYCSVSRGRYAAYAWSHQLLDAQQRIAAQYALFAKAE